MFRLGHVTAQPTVNCVEEWLYASRYCCKESYQILASNEAMHGNFLLVLKCCLRYCSAGLVWSPLPLRPFPFTAFLCWHPHLSDSNTKEKVPRATCFLPSRPCHLEQTPLLASCSNTIPVQNSTQNHTILLSVRTRLLERICVFNCSPYFSSCKTACDLHLRVSE